MRNNNHLILAILFLFSLSHSSYGQLSEIPEINVFFEKASSDEDLMVIPTADLAKFIIKDEALADHVDGLIRTHNTLRFIPNPPTSDDDREKAKKNKVSYDLYWKSIKERITRHWRELKESENMIGGGSPLSTGQTDIKSQVETLITTYVSANCQGTVESTLKDFINPNQVQSAIDNFLSYNSGLMKTENAIEAGIQTLCDDATIYSEWESLKRAHMLVPQYEKLINVKAPGAVDIPGLVTSLGSCSTEGNSIYTQTQDKSSNLARDVEILKKNIDAIKKTMKKSNDIYDKVQAWVQSHPCKCDDVRKELINGQCQCKPGFKPDDDGDCLTPEELASRFSEQSGSSNAGCQQLIQSIYQQVADNNKRWNGEFESIANQLLAIEKELENDGDPCRLTELIKGPHSDITTIVNAAKREKEVVVNNSIDLISSEGCMDPYFIRESNSDLKDLERAYAAVEEKGRDLLSELSDRKELLDDHPCLKNCDQIIQNIEKSVLYGHYENLTKVELPKLNDDLKLLNSHKEAQVNGECREEEIRKIYDGNKLNATTWGITLNKIDDALGWMSQEAISELEKNRCPIESYDELNRNMAGFVTSYKRQLNIVTSIFNQFDEILAWSYENPCVTSSKSGELGDCPDPHMVRDAVTEECECQEPYFPDAFDPSACVHIDDLIGDDKIPEEFDCSLYEQIGNEVLSKHQNIIMPWNARSIESEILAIQLMSNPDLDHCQNAALVSTIKSLQLNEARRSRLEYDIYLDLSEMLAEAISCKEEFRLFSADIAALIDDIRARTIALGVIMEKWGLLQCKDEDIDDLAHSGVIDPDRDPTSTLTGGSNQEFSGDDRDNDGDGRTDEMPGESPGGSQGRTDGGLDDIYVLEREVTITIWDSGGCEDGDIIDLTINNERILSSYLLSQAQNVINYTLPTGRNLLTLFAVSGGTDCPQTTPLPINSASISIEPSKSGGRQTWRIFEGETRMAYIVVE